MSGAATNINLAPAGQDFQDTEYFYYFVIVNS